MDAVVSDFRLGVGLRQSEERVDLAEALAQGQVDVEGPGLYGEVLAVEDAVFAQLVFVDMYINVRTPGCICNCGW